MRRFNLIVSIIIWGISLMTIRLEISLHTRDLIGVLALINFILTSINVIVCEKLNILE